MECYTEFLNLILNDAFVGCDLSGVIENAEKLLCFEILNNFKEKFNFL